jgi:hypothetical protein
MSRFRRGVEQLLRAKLHRQNLTPQLQVRIDELAAKQAKAREAKNTQKRSSAEIGVMSLIPPVMAQPANRPHPSAGPALRLRRVLAAITAPGSRSFCGHSPHRAHLALGWEELFVPEMRGFVPSVLYDGCGVFLVGDVKALGG